MFGRSYTGRGQRQGMGFGFRGDSPPWPYVGRGRGGLPRCSYPGLTRAAFPYKAGAYGPAASTSGQELDVLRSQAETTRQQLRDMESRIKELEKKEEK